MVMKTFERIWRSKGLMVFVYLDDILLLGPSPKTVEKHLRTMVQDLADSGFLINLKKSFLEPSQNVPHLGFQIDLKEGRLKICPQKLKNVRKELGKLVTKTTMSCRKMAAILGKVRSFLVALPFLRAFTDTMCKFVDQAQTQGWDHTLQVPPSLKEQLVDVDSLLKTWTGRPFQEKPQKILYSDSSDLGWGGLNPKTGEFVQEFWRDRCDLHINVKELEAALHTVRSLAQPGENVELTVDNQVTFYYLLKGGGGKTLSTSFYAPSFCGV